MASQASRTEKVVSDLNKFFPQYIAVPNIFYTSFLDINAFVHPISAILNAGRIELTKGDYDFYWGGISPGVCANMEAIDNEKIAISEAIGFKQESLNELVHKYYGHPECRHCMISLVTVRFMEETPEAKAPSTTHHRYITEDVPYGLVPLSGLAEKVNVPTPHMDAVITLASTFNGENYREMGRSLKNIGFADQDNRRNYSFCLLWGITEDTDEFYVAKRNE